MSITNVSLEYVQKTVYPDKDNPIILNIVFEEDRVSSFGLNNFDAIKVSWLGVEYTSSLNTDIVKITSNTQLTLNFGDVTTSEDYPTYLIITGINTDYPNGFLITNKCTGNIGIPCIC